MNSSSIKQKIKLNRPEETDRLFCCSQQGNPPPFATSSEQNQEHPAMEHVLIK